MAIASYNYTPHEELDKLTVAKLFFGREIRTPLVTDDFDEVVQQIV